jgi:lipopolysaccharide transport system permease protein
MFAEILLRSQGMFVEHANLLKKASFPRICLPVIVVGSAVSNFAIVYGVFLTLLLVSGRFPGPVVIFALAPLALLALLAAGLGILLGTVHVFFRDVGQVVGIVLQLVFWLSPIVYPLAALPKQYAEWIAYNPLTPIVKTLQEVFVNGVAPPMDALLFPFAVSIFVAAAAWAVFKRQAPFVVDEL